MTLVLDGTADVETAVTCPSIWQHIFTPKRAAAQQALWDEQARRRVHQMILDRQIREARENVMRLDSLLQPERRLEWAEQLAQWQAHLDSLETDGVYAIPKGQD